jgi:hypothetical protein
MQLFITKYELKITVFWNVTLCSLVDRYQHVRGTVVSIFYTGNATGFSIPDYTVSHPRKE